VGKDYVSPCLEDRSGNLNSERIDRMDYIVRVFYEDIFQKQRLFAEKGIKVLFEDPLVPDMAIVSTDRNREDILRFNFVYSVTESRNDGVLIGK
jgi:hypothetical protein